MSLPALQIFRQENPDIEITLLARPELEPFWRMSPVIDIFQPLGKRFSTLRKLRQTHYDRAYILPDSFREAFMIFRAGVPRRIGLRGHWRRLLLTEVIHRPDGHRQFEYMNILGVQGNPPAPQLAVPHESFQTLERKLCHLSSFVPPDGTTADRPDIGPKRSERCPAFTGQRPKEVAKSLCRFFQTLEEDRPPGARRVITLLPGSAGNWPAGHFVLLSKKLREELNALVLLSGSPESAEICAEIDAFAGPEVLNLTGRITMPERMALLKASDCVVVDDFDGAHLAAATGTPVVAVACITDSAKTGLLGKNLVLQKNAVQMDSPDAIRPASAAVMPEEVYSAVTALLEG